MTPSSTFQESFCLSASFQPSRSFPLNRGVKPSGGFFVPASLSAARAVVRRPSSRARGTARLMMLSSGWGEESDRSKDRLDDAAPADRQRAIQGVAHLRVRSVAEAVEDRRLQV